MCVGVPDDAYVYSAISKETFTCDCAPRLYTSCLKRSVRGERVTEYVRLDRVEDRDEHGGVSEITIVKEEFEDVSQATNRMRGNDNQERR